MVFSLFYKAVVKGEGPSYVIDEFKRQANIHSHLTRNLSVPIYLLSSFLYHERSSQLFTLRQLTCQIYCQPAFLWEPGVSMSRRRYFEEDCRSTIWCRGLVVNLEVCVVGLDLGRSVTGGT